MLYIQKRPIWVLIFPQLAHRTIIYLNNYTLLWIILLAFSEEKVYNIIIEYCFSTKTIIYLRRKNV